MDELEQIRQKKLAELQAQQQNQLEQQQVVQDQINQAEALVKQYLTKEAIERYGNLKIAHTEKAIALLGVLGQMIQAGHIKNQITDEQLKELLKKLEPSKKEFKIKRV